MCVLSVISSGDIQRSCCKVLMSYFSISFEEDITLLRESDFYHKIVYIYLRLFKRWQEYLYPYNNEIHKFRLKKKIRNIT